MILDFLSGDPTLKSHLSVRRIIAWLRHACSPAVFVDSTRSILDYPNFYSCMRFNIQDNQTRTCSEPFVITMHEKFGVFCKLIIQVEENVLPLLWKLKQWEVVEMGRYILADSSARIQALRCCASIRFVHFPSRLENSNWNFTQNMIDFLKLFWQIIRKFILPPTVLYTCCCTEKGWFRSEPPPTSGRH